MFRRVGCIILATVLFACGKQEEWLSVQHRPVPQLPTIPYDFTNVVLPEHFLEPALGFFEYMPASNTTTDEGATLGRVLFYDKLLSASGTVSCASCHRQPNGFADPKAGSKGHAGGITPRNASHLVNLRYNFQLFWDLRANGLENQVLVPVQDVLEMGLTLDELTQRVSNAAYYPALFEAAFGDPAVSADRIARALSQFIRSIISFQTRYDQGVANGFSDFTASETLGMQLFYNGITRCNQCHMTHNFYSPDAFNNGLDTAYADGGLGALTGEPADMGKFKVPSLRNVAISAPYMHDGRFATLEEVIAHYNSGVQPHPFLDERLTASMHTGGTPYALGLTAAEQKALVDFLKTLTDEHLVSDVRFSDPFIPQ
jgi:cytochrome c peroxidase